jgi:transposase|nr:MAG TPA_asm: terminase small subunit [Caudoviricetes sp.]
MAKSKWETHVKDRLIEVEGWARDGLTDEQIAKNLGISIRTFYEYKEKYPQFLQSLKRGKEVVDREVENALLKKAIGGKEKVLKPMKIKNVIYSDAGKKLKENEEIVMVEEEVLIIPDTTAQIFWLKNRKPDVWRDKTAVEHSGEIKGDNPFSNLTTEELKKVIFGDK